METVLINAMFDKPNIIRTTELPCQSWSAVEATTMYYICWDNPDPPNHTH